MVPFKLLQVIHSGELKTLPCSIPCTIPCKYCVVLWITFSSEIDTEDIRQLLHEDLSHLQRTHYNLQVLAG